jgi:hypothetical protein
MNLLSQDLSLVDIGTGNFLQLIAGKFKELWKNQRESQQSGPMWVRLKKRL